MSRRFFLPRAESTRSVSSLAIILIIASMCVPLFTAGVGSPSAFAEDTAATPVSAEAGTGEPKTESETIVPVDPEGQGEGSQVDESPLPEPVDAVIDDDTPVEPTGLDPPSGTSGEVPDPDSSPEASAESPPVHQRQMAGVEIAAESEAETPVSGSVTITATDQYGTPLPGIEFRIPSPYGLHLPPLYSGNTGSRGTILVEGLLLDTYMITVAQVTAPSGCSAAGSQAVDLTTRVPHLDLHFVSRCAEMTDTGSVTMSATDQYGRPIAGAGFQIQSPYGSSMPPLFSGSTNASGVVRAESLLLDRYMITVAQVSAPAGCTPAGSQTVELTFHIPDLTLHFVSMCEVTTAVGSVTISLTDQHGTPLPGIAFWKLVPIDYSPPRYEYVGPTDAAGLTLVESLPVEDYAVTIQQRSAPEGCTAAADQTVVVSVDTPHPTLHFVNVCAVEPPTGTLTVQTTDQDATPLAGVAYEMRQGDAVVESWVSGGGVDVLRDLPLDTPFTVHQVGVPDGCVAEPAQAFTLTADRVSQGMAFANACRLPGARGDITVSKIDQFSSLRAGAEFELLQAGTVVHRWTSTNAGGETIPGLALDVEYTIHEVYAPLGCRAGADVTLTLSVAEPSQVFAIRNECVNALGSITLTKTDQSGSPLPGVEFEVFSADGRLVTSMVTRPDGVAHFAALPLTVTYTLHEVSAPEGCAVAADKTVTLTTDMPNQAITLINECEGADPSPSPSPSPSSTPTTPESTPDATPTATPGTPASTATEASTSIPLTPTPVSSTSGTETGVPVARGVGRDSGSGALATDSAVGQTVLGLPNTGDMAPDQSTRAWPVLLVTSGMLLIACAGVRMRRE